MVFPFDTSSDEERKDESTWVRNLDNIFSDGNSASHANLMPWPT